jgi:hypothetical protein
VQVPLVNWENIPVSASTSASVSADHVKQALVIGGRTTLWTVKQVGDGELEAVFSKQRNKHVVVISIRYDAQKYSVSYKRSENMVFVTEMPLNLTMSRHRNSPSLAEQAVIRQRKLFAQRADLPYAKTQAHAFIHPFYEDWVYDMLDAVRENLKRGT